MPTEASSHGARSTSPPEGFDARMGAILRYLHERFGDGGKTSAEVAADLGMDPGECAAKLRSLANDRVVQVAPWHRPMRYWAEHPVSLALRYADALEGGGADA